jgi:uncharacterized OsmC-like protein
MNKDARIREAQNRYIKVLNRQPQLAQNTYKGTATIEDGFICNFTQGEQSIVMDVSKVVGGDDTGPTPGFLARASTAGCVSMGIKQAAVKEGLDIDSVSVDIEMDFAEGASLGFGEDSAAPLETRFFIRIDTDSPESEVVALVDRALEKDTFFLALRDAQSVKINVNVID